MKIVMYGLTITSSWGNSHAATYRPLCKALARRGHAIHFVEKDLQGYRGHRDLPHPGFCTVHRYDDWERSARSLVRLSKDADVTVMGSRFPDAVAATGALLEAGRKGMVFYDLDTPITISYLRTTGSAPYLDAAHISQFAAYLSSTGGPVLRELEERFGARCAMAFYSSVDPELYRPTRARAEYACDLSYLGTYAVDRQARLMQLLNGAAMSLPRSRFIVAGAQYLAGIEWCPNVEQIPHLNPPEHPAFYSSARFTLNLTRDSAMAAGYSPSVRLFEASACGAAILTDAWKGLESFLTPQREVLVPADKYEVAEILRSFPEEERVRVGLNARERILAQHTASHRAVEFEEMLENCHVRGAAGKKAKREAAPPAVHTEPSKRASARQVPLPM